MPDEKSEAYYIGSPSNFHISTATYTDLTRSYPSKASSDSILLSTTSNGVLLDPAKTALVIIDMQNFFLSGALGRKQGAGHAACDKLASLAIPAARKAGIQIVWLNWGLTDDDIANMPPKVLSSFGDQGKPVEYQHSDVGGRNGKGEFQKDREVYRGMGSEMGVVNVDGKEIDAGKMLMRDQWNAALYPPLDRMCEKGQSLNRKPDVWMHKDRMSGMWGATTMCQEFLEKAGIRTLLFTGVNTDQCVSGTLTDSYNKGFDCVMLSDGCGTTSPAAATEGIEYNVGRTWGWLSDCKSLADAVEKSSAM